MRYEGGEGLRDHSARVAVEQQAGVEDECVHGERDDHERRYEHEYGSDAGEYVRALLDAAHVAALHQCHANADEEEHLALLYTVNIYIF